MAQAKGDGKFSVQDKHGNWHEYDAKDFRIDLEEFQTTFETQVAKAIRRMIVLDWLKHFICPN